MHIAIDRTGSLVSFKDKVDGTEYLSQASPLVSCYKYDNDTLKLHPVSARRTGLHLVELSFADGMTLVVSIKRKDGYFRMEIVDADPLSEISHIVWGPYLTNMHSYIGTTLGIVRSDNFSIGLMTLDPNTDYPSDRPHVAQYTEEGASLQLHAFDHTRGVFRDFGKMGKENGLRRAEPAPITVIGSAVALYSSRSGDDNELDAIGHIELEEGLPHPTINGVWNKLTREQTRTCLWAFYGERDFDDYIVLAKKIGAGMLCNPSCFFSNWGHFEIDRNIFPDGVEGLRKKSREADSSDIASTLYTLTTFTKSINQPEPYLTPVPDSRLARWKSESNLAEDFAEQDSVMVIMDGTDVWNTVSKTKSIRVGNELILFGKAIQNEGKIVLFDCKRGTEHTVRQSHKAGAEVSFLFYSGYDNYYSGTLDMLSEQSNRLYQIFHETGQKMFMLDGYESCMEAGYSSLGGNLYVDEFYRNCLLDSLEIYWSGSRYSPYSWHHLSHISWGEGDRDKGIRGTMLDYRLALQVILKNDLMPKKLGQYYPDEATVADFEWLMALATGWDSGLDILLYSDKFKDNPDYGKIISKLSLWNQARKENVFTEDELRSMRQTDREYSLSRKPDGTWNLEFVGFWQSDRVKILPPENLPVQSLSGAAVKPCSIDWSWTHNPATYYEVVLSDDMVHDRGQQKSIWEVTYPEFKNPEEAWYPTNYRHFQYVIRLPEDAPCAVKDIELSFNGELIRLPLTLEPGQYLTMPQLVPMICVYNSNHELVCEKQIRGDIPSVLSGSRAEVTLACTPVEEKMVTLIMNIRCQNGYYFPEWLTNK